MTWWLDYLQLYHHPLYLHWPNTTVKSSLTELHPGGSICSSCHSWSFALSDNALFLSLWGGLVLIPCIPASAKMSWDGEWNSHSSGYLATHRFVHSSVYRNVWLQVLAHDADTYVLLRAFKEQERALMSRTVICRVTVLKLWIKSDVRKTNT